MAKTKRSDRRKKPAESKQLEKIAQLVPEEILAAVTNYFCQAFFPAEIATEIRSKYGIRMSREMPYKLIQQAAKRKMLQFNADPAAELSSKISNQFQLQKAEVVFTNQVSDVARRAASMVLELIWVLTRVLKKDLIRIGFAGGNSIRLVAQYLAQAIQEHPEFLPDQIIFQALVPGADVRAPFTDPNVFFSYFLGSAFYDPSRQKQQLQFIMLQAPAFVTPEQYTSLKKMSAITEAWDNAKELDIIIGSAADYDDPHGAVQQYYLRKYAAELKEDQLTELQTQLKECTGDMFWLPISKQGPIETEDFPIRSMTLVNLKDLPKRIAENLKVVLVVGPCAICNRPKMKVLETILQNEQGPLISHLVCDSRSARGLLELKSLKKNPDKIFSLPPEELSNA